MARKDPLAPLLTTLRDLGKWLGVRKVPHTLIGGVAASLLGRPRVTRDIDVLVFLEEDRWKEFLQSGSRFGFVPRQANTLSFAKKARVILLRHKSTEIDLDIVLGALPFEEDVISRAHSKKVRGISLRLPRPEDLIIMKAVAQRPQDLLDIESIIDTNPKLNLPYIQKWLRKFAAALEMPGIFNDFKAILSRKRKRKK